MIWLIRSQNANIRGYVTDVMAGQPGSNGVRSGNRFRARSEEREKQSLNQKPDGRLQMTHIKMVFSGIVALLLLVPLMAVAQQVGEMTLDHEEAAKHFPSRGYSPYADRGFPTFPLWGDRKSVV